MYERTSYGDHTLMMADRIETERDRATTREDERMASMRGGPHRYVDGVSFFNWCDICGVAKAVHL